MNLLIRLFIIHIKYEQTQTINLYDNQGYEFSLKF